MEGRLWERQLTNSNLHQVFSQPPLHQRLSTDVGQKWSNQKWSLWTRQSAHECGWLCFMDADHKISTEVWQMMNTVRGWTGWHVECDWKTLFEYGLSQCWWLRSVDAIHKICSTGKQMLRARSRSERIWRILRNFVKWVDVRQADWLGWQFVSEIEGIFRRG